MGTVILTKEEAKALRRLAKEYGVTPSEAIRLLIRSADAPRGDQSEQRNEADECRK